jgi:Myo-inositol oxygenase
LIALRINQMDAALCDANGAKANNEKAAQSTAIDAIKTDADKSVHDFRSYDAATTDPRVIEHYRDMRQHQTVDFVRRMHIQYSFDNGAHRAVMTVKEALDALENYVVSKSCNVQQCVPEVHE